MGPYTLSYTSVFLAALIAHSTLAAPTVTELEIRQTDVKIDPSTIVPEVIKHGPLDQAGIDALVANLTGGSVQAGSKLQTRQAAITKNGPFLSYLNGLILPGTDPTCAEFLVEGPILKLEAAMGSSNIRGLKLTSIAGNSTDITGEPNVVNPAPGAFEFGANERVTEFIVIGDTWVLGFTFKTDAGKSYEAVSEIGRQVMDDPQTMKTSIPVGSGIIARIRGTQCTSGVFGAFGIDFLDELASISISNITYSGFTNNIAPAGEGNVVTVGGQSLDNRNSSIEQGMTLVTMESTTSEYSIMTNTNWKVGAGITVKGEVSIPFLAKKEVAVETHFEIGGATEERSLTAQTKTSTAWFPLKCPAFKYCFATASFLTFKLDVNLEATFSAITKSGGEYTWVQKGTYKGSDSLSMKLTVHEVDSV